MSCPNLLDSGQPCGDEGHLCEACSEAAAREYGYLKHVSKYAAGGTLDQFYFDDLGNAGRLAGRSR